MRKKQKTELTLEIKEAVAIRPQRNLAAHCRGCRKQARMVAANEAAVISGMSAREIYRLVEGGQVHFIEDCNGLLYVCVPSLHQLISEADGSGAAPAIRFDSANKRQ